MPTYSTLPILLPSSFTLILLTGSSHATILLVLTTSSHRLYLSIYPSNIVCYSKDSFITSYPTTAQNLTVLTALPVYTNRTASTRRHGVIPIICIVPHISIVFAHPALLLVFIARNLSFHTLYCGCFTAFGLHAKKRFKGFVWQCSPFAEPGVRLARALSFRCLARCGGLGKYDFGIG